MNRKFSPEHNVNNYFVVPCKKYPFFKQRLGNVFVEDSCNCSNLFHGIIAKSVKPSVMF